MKKFKLKRPSESIISQCFEFAKSSSVTSLDEYARRNQNAGDKIIQDIYYGKVAEFMVSNMLLEHGRQPSTPDLEIYQARQKSYDADLTCNGVAIHVKSHMYSGYYPVSWVFQKRDRLTQGGSKDYLALVVMDERFSGHCYLLQANGVKFEPPKKESLRANKVCIYERSLK